MTSATGVAPNCKVQYSKSKKEYSTLKTDQKANNRC